MTSITRRSVFSSAVPLIVANATTPLLGIVDTAVLGHGGRPVDLAAISLGVLIFSFMYWAFGFLRMATTGFVAQAEGRGDSEELLAAVVRPVLLAVSAGSLLILLHRGIEVFAFAALGGGPEAEAAARGYLRARIWGAPGALMGYCFVGLLIGLGKTRHLLLAQLATNGLNMALDVLFVVGLGWGVRGVGAGTAIAEWSGALIMLWIALPLLRERAARIDWHRAFEAAAVRRTLKANSDILVRTLAMLFGFAYFIDQGARLGTVTLAANHLLLQLVTFSAFFLDGYAHVAESLVGAAKGAGDRTRFDLALRRTSEVAVITAFLLAVGIALLGPLAVSLLTDLAVVRETAVKYMVPVATYVACSVLAFQLDGVFIGATETRLMRNMSLLSVIGFVGLCLLLAERYGNTGLWWAFVGYVVLRGLSLLSVLPRLRRGLTGSGVGSAQA